MSGSTRIIKHVSELRSWIILIIVLYLNDCVYNIDDDFYFGSICTPPRFKIKCINIALTTHLRIGIQSIPQKNALCIFYIKNTYKHSFSNF